MKMLLIKDYYPINREYVKEQWNDIMNVPNDQWNIKQVDRAIDIINDENYPLTLRTVQLNMLPALIIRIIDLRNLPT